MAITKRIYPSGKTAWFVDWYDASGKRCRKAFPTKKQAEDAQAKFKTQRFEEKVMGVKKGQKFYFEELVKKFVKFSEVDKKRRTHETNLVRLIPLEKFFNAYLCDDIDISKIDEYKAYRLSSVSSSTINRELAVFRHIINKGIEWKMVTKEIPVKMLKEPPGKIRYLSEEELDALIRELPKSPDYLQVIVLIALNTGMRRGEILALRWPNVNLKQRLIHIEETQDIKGIVDTCKDNERRDLPINDNLFEALNSWKKKSRNSEKLFSVHVIREAWDSLLNRAKIEKFRFHDLRHTFASYLVMEGTDLTTVAKLMGHSTIEMTMRYAHLSPDHRKMAIEKIGHLLDTSIFRHQLESQQIEGDNDN